MFRRAIGLSVAIMILITLFITQCGKQDPVLARIGHEVITVQDYVKQNGELKKEKDFETDLNRLKTQLDNMVNDKLLLIVAREEGFDRDSLILEKTENARLQALIIALFQKKVTDVVIKESEIQKFYDYNRTERDIREIAFMIPANADSLKRAAVYQKAEDALKAVNEGAHFASMARKVSENKQTSPKGGLVEKVKFQNLNDPVAKVIFSLKEGRHSGIIESHSKLYIVQLEKIYPVDLPPYKEYRETIAERLSKQKRSEIDQVAQKYWNNLKKRKNVVPDSANIDSCAAMMRALNTYDRDVFVAGIDSLSQEQRDLVLVSYDGDQITVDGLKARMVKLLPKVIRGEPFGNRRSIDKFLEQWLMSNLLSGDAIDAGLDKDKAIREKIDTVVNNEILRAYPERFIVSDTEPTDDEILSYYQENIELEKTSLDQSKAQIRRTLISEKTKDQKEAWYQKHREARNVYINEAAVEKCLKEVYDRSGTTVGENREDQ